MKRRTGFALLAACLVVLAAFCAPQALQAQPALALSPEERAWLDAHRDSITLTYDVAFPPIEFQDDEGRYAGLGADIVARIEALLGVTFRKQPTKDWNAFLKDLESGETHLNAGMASTPEREAYASCTTPYIKLPLAIITSTKGFGGQPVDWKGLKGRRVAVVSGYMSESYVRQHGDGQFTVVRVGSVLEGLRGVSFGVVDAFVDNLASSSFYIERDSLTNLRVAGSVEAMFPMSICVSRKYPLLLSAVQKALAVIPEEDLERSRRKWISLGGEELLSRETLRLITFAGLFAALLLIGLAVISYVLKRRLDEKIRSLHQAQQELVDQTQRLALATEASSAGIWDFSPATGQAIVSDQWHAMLGLAPGALEGTLESWLALLHPEDRVVYWQALANYSESGGKGLFEAEARMRHADGGWRWVLGKGRAIGWDGEGRANRIIGISLDITERKRSEELLRQSQEKFSRIFEMAPECIFFVQFKDMTVIDTNAAFEVITGHPRTEAIGRGVAELGLWADPEEHLEFLQRLKTESHVKNFEFLLRRKDGELRRVVHSSQLVSLGGEQCSISIIHDITDERRMQELLIQSEKMMSVGSLAAGVAHEINNPLGIVHQAVQNLIQRTSPDQRKNRETAASIGLDMDLLQQYLRLRKLDVFLLDIQAAALRASGIIRNMLNFSRRSESKRAACDLRRIIEQSVVLASSDYDLKKAYDFKRIQISLDLDSEYPQCGCTETELEQVLLNLLRNAAQAMAMAQPPTPAPRIEIRLRALEDGVRIEVSDNGPGMEPEVQRKAFEPFYTTKPPGVGTGLGLSVAYFIISKGHRGRMWVESTPGSGTTFYIELPAEAQEAPHV